MDIGTIAGLAVGFMMTGMGIILGGVGLAPYISIDSVLIVLLGSFGAMMVANPLDRMLGVGAYISQTFKIPTLNEEELISQLVGFADRARKEGLLALEDSMDAIEDEFMRKGLQLVVDGTDPEIVKSILYVDLNQLQARHAIGMKIMDDWAKIGPAFGMIGTLVGLVAMLGSIGGDTAAIGRGMQTALITTLYGSFFANLFLIPWKSKMEDRDLNETRVKEIVIEGVLSIQSGDNPRILLEKLVSFLPPTQRQAVRAESGAD